MKCQIAMKINKLNYEAFMIDYIEGNLSHTDRQAMDSFLNENPLLKQEINMYLEAPIIKEDPSIVFNSKAKLLKKEQGISSIVWLIPLLLIVSIGIWYLLKDPAVTPVKEHIVPMAESENLKEQQILSQQEGPKTLVDSKTVQINDSSVANQEKQDLQKLREKQEIQENKKAKPRRALTNQQKASPNQTPEITNTQKKNTERVSIAFEEPTENEPVLIVQLETEEILNQKMVSLENLSGLALKSIESNTRTLKLQDAMVVDTFDLRNSDIVFIPEQPKKKWWKVFVPQAYEDVSLENVATASTTFQSVAEDKEGSVMPLQTIKK